MGKTEGARIKDANGLDTASRGLGAFGKSMDVGYLSMLNVLFWLYAHDAYNTTMTEHNGI